MDPSPTTPPPEPDHAPPAGGFDGASWDWQAAYEQQRSQQPPQHGWRPPLPDLGPVLALLDTMRRMLPPELQDQFNALQREVLLTLRSLIDWQLERLEQGTRGVAVEEIQID